MLVQITYSAIYIIILFQFMSLLYLWHTVRLIHLYDMAMATNSISSHEFSLVKSMKQQQQAGLNVDFMLSSGGNRVFVHSCLIRNTSSLLTNLLGSSCSCSQPHAILLPSTYSTILSSFVSLMYTGIANNLAKASVTKILNLAKDLGFDNVACDEHINQKKKIFKVKSKVDIVERKEETVEEGDEIEEREDYTGEIPSTCLVEKRASGLKTNTNIVAQNSKKSLSLSFPQSRIDRNVLNLSDFEPIKGFKGRIQQ